MPQRRFDGLRRVDWPLSRPRLQHGFQAGGQRGRRPRRRSRRLLECLLVVGQLQRRLAVKRKQRLVLSIQAGRGGENTFDPADPSEATDPGRGLERVEQERRIQTALNRLSAEHRAVLILKDMEGQKYEEMAEILQVPIGTIRSRLHRARTELREVLEQEEG